MTKDPINEEWLISAALNARNAKTGLNPANGLQFGRPTSHSAKGR